MIGNLDELDTTAKGNLVAAVNEAFASGGGTVSPAAVQKIVDDYLKANPPAAGKDGVDGKDGADGITPTIGSNGNWYLGSVDTGKPSRGAKGDAGVAGHSPAVTATKLGKVTTIQVDGADIVTINDGADGQNGAPGKDGSDGIDGVTPVIGSNGNWYLGDTDTGKPSRGEKGDPGKDAAVDISLGLTAAIGQTIIVKAVDADGKPTEWEAAELLADSTLLPIATNDTLGGVKPVIKTDQMTQHVGVDPTGALFTSPSIIENGSVTPDKTSFIRKAYHNILNWDDPDAQDGYFFYSDSSANTTGDGNAAYSMSGFIPVTAGLTYGFAYVRVGKWLDAQKNFLSTFAPNRLANIHFTAPENAAYMRIDVDDTRKEQAYIYEYIADDYAYSAYGTEYEIVPKDAKYTDMLTRAVNDTLQDTDISDYVRDNSLRWAHLNGISEFHWNIVNPENCRFGIQIDSVTGEEKLFNNTALYKFVSDYEEVVPGEVLYGPNDSVYCYDSDKQYLSELTWNNGSYTIPENGRFVRVESSGYLTAQDSARIYLLRNQYGKAFAYNNNYSYNVVFPMFDNSDSLNGFKGYLGIRRRANQTIAVIGDSFTAPSTWVNIMCENLGAYKLKNYAVSGGAFSKYSGVPKTAYEQAQEMVTDGKTPDIILVTLGTNDSNNDRDIGEINYSNDVGTFDLTTFSGGLQACLNHLANSFPSAKIYVGWTPMVGLYSTIHDPEPYIARMKSICMAYGITYIETRTCGVSPLINAHAECFEAGTSGGHPTNAGQQRIGAYMTQVMECAP